MSTKIPACHITHIIRYYKSTTHSFNTNIPPLIQKPVWSHVCKLPLEAYILHIMYSEAYTTVVKLWNRELVKSSKGILIILLRFLELFSSNFCSQIVLWRRDACCKQFQQEKLGAKVELLWRSVLHRRDLISFHFQF